MAMQRGESEITEYYRGKKIFLTGATGFIGKVLIEKLLYSCEVSAIYCLVRQKKGLTAVERIQKICEEKLFDRLRDVDPTFPSKIQAIPGDITAEGLGICDTDRETLQQNVNIVIHSAATVKFDESLKLAVSMNLLGVKKLLDLCQDMRKLEVLVHISTAYAHCEKEHIEEMVYPPHTDPYKVIDAVEWLDEDIINSISHKLISPKPNTYTYTKQLAESLLLLEGKHLPLVIVRPSIVTSSMCEPAVGWIDNYNGVSGLALAVGKGLMQTVRAEPNGVADIIPVDLVVNTIITSAWYKHVHEKKKNGTVYHITSGDTNPVTWGEMVLHGVSYLEKEPMDQCFRRPKFNILTPNKLVHQYWMLVSHLLPAYITDFIGCITGSKLRMVRMYSRLHKAMSTLEYFTMRQWNWSQTNTNTLKSAMSAVDLKKFNCESRTIDWESYIRIYTSGIKKFILKEDPDNIETARAHVRKLRNLRYCFNVCSIAVLWKLLQSKSSALTRLRSVVLRLIYKVIEIFTWKTVKLHLSS